MTTVDFITMLFCRIDDAMHEMPKHPLALLHPSELATLGVLFALKGVGERAFYRWVERDYRSLFPHLPERSHLLGRFVAWDCNWARTLDRDFRPLIAALDGVTVVLTDGAWHGKTDDPPNMKVCPRGIWNTRMLVETVLSMLTTVCHLKKVAHRAADYFRMRMAFITAAFNLLVEWDGLQPDEHGFVKLSIAEFSL